MKPETEKGLRAASTETRQEIIRLLAELMDAESFVAALDDKDNPADGLSADGQAILAELQTEPDSDEPDEIILSEADADRLHEAICEGRKQDAVDILNEVTGENFRSVEAQTNLFPDRCSL